MRKMQLVSGGDPGVVEVLSPFTGQYALVHRRSRGNSSRVIALFPGQDDKLMRIPQVGYSLETAAFGVFAAAAFSVIGMLILGII
jgi:hypothetical protein